VKPAFASSASLKDSARLVISSLDGDLHRAIDIHEGKEVDGTAFKALVRQAIAHIFAILHVHDLGATLRGKGIALDDQFGLIKPMKMLSALSQDPALTQIAEQVKDKTTATVDEAGGSSPVRSAMPMHS
jgi:hypothetical protein